MEGGEPSTLGLLFSYVSDARVTKKTVVLYSECLPFL